MIGALRNIDPQEVALISLDNDLDSIVVNGQLVDAGDGIAVARFLVDRALDGSENSLHTRPVIIHTTNQQAACEMEGLFKAANWQFHRIVPYDGELWIGEIWIRRVRSIIIRTGSARESGATTQ